MEFASCVQAAVLDADVVFVPAALYAAAGVHTPSDFPCDDSRCTGITDFGSPRGTRQGACRRVYHRKPFCTDPSE